MNCRDCDRPKSTCQCRRRVMFGKHKGDTFIYVLNDDPEYCNWIVKQDCNGLMAQFRNYILERCGKRVKPIGLQAVCLLD